MGNLVAELGLLSLSFQTLFFLLLFAGLFFGALFSRQGSFSFLCLIFALFFFFEAVCLLSERAEQTSPLKQKSIYPYQKHINNET